jgi:hypothetical protein
MLNPRPHPKKGRSWLKPLLLLKPKKALMRSAAYADITTIAPPTAVSRENPNAANVTDSAIILPIAVLRGNPNAARAIKSVTRLRIVGEKMGNQRNVLILHKKMKMPK